MPKDGSSLSNQAILTKIDKLRELNIGKTIPLPQLVVVGDQSSGKSSVLESLTGFSFPRGHGVCTRYATQISCSRDPVSSITISIIPREDADDTLKKKLLEFRPVIEGELDEKELSQIFEDANKTMGIRMHVSEHVDPGLGAFSQDKLKIEIRGPEQIHLTVIDVPGLFENPTPGLTTDEDVTLVRNMVKEYMHDKRTIILAVMDCNIDVANQGILKIAKQIDDTGSRTMGVLTKPDLVQEVSKQEAVMQVLLGNAHKLKLGYYAIKNRGADDTTSTPSSRAKDEESFFREPAWARAKDRCGTMVLKKKLQQLLFKITKQGLPAVKADISKLLDESRKKLGDMGQPRGSATAQRQYLGILANQFQNVTQRALNAEYSRENLFRDHPDLKLITRVFKLQTEFAETFRLRGHSDNFDESDHLVATEDSHDQLSDGDSDGDEALKYPELQKILLEQGYKCPEPKNTGSIMNRVYEVYESSRGPDLGTFGGAILSTIFEEQSEKWPPLTLCHVSKVISMVHDFIHSLLQHIFMDDQVRNQLWENILWGELKIRYNKAIDNANFLLAIERGNRPMTFNYRYNENLQQKRGERLMSNMKNIAIQVQTVDGQSVNGEFVPLSAAQSMTVNKTNEQQTCDDILDVFRSYYTVAQERIVDVIFQQSIMHHLLEGDGSPLRVFSPDLIMGLKDNQLELIAGEDAETIQERDSLEIDIERYEEALKVFSGA